MDDSAEDLEQPKSPAQLVHDEIQSISEVEDTLSPRSALLTDLSPDTAEVNRVATLG